MGGLFDFLGKLVKDDAEHKTQIRVAKDHVLIPGRTEVSPVAEEHYVRIWLAEMFLRDNSSWFTKRYPLTYSLVELNFAGQSVEFTNVSGKNKLDIKQTDLGRSLLYNYPLTPLLPFRGGTIGLDCGLVSMTASNLVSKFAGVVSEFAGKLGGAQATAAVDLAASVAAGVQDLLGAGDAVSKLYYHNVFSGAQGGAPLTSGYLFLSERAEGKVDGKRLWVTEDGVREGELGGTLQPLAAQDYLLFQIECLQERDDYRSFPYIRQPFEDALDAKAEGDDAKGQALISQAKRAVQRSPDFTALDRKRIRKALDDAFANEGFASDEEGVESPAEESPIERFTRSRFEDAIRSVSIDEARDLPDAEDED